MLFSSLLASFAEDVWHVPSINFSVRGVHLLDRGCIQYMSDMSTTKSIMSVTGAVCVKIEVIGRVMLMFLIRRIVLQLSLLLLASLKLLIKLVYFGLFLIYIYVCQFCN